MIRSINPEIFKLIKNESWGCAVLWLLWWLLLWIILLKEINYNNLMFMVMQWNLFYTILSLTLLGKPYLCFCSSKRLISPCTYFLWSLFTCWALGLATALFTGIGAPTTKQINIKMKLILPNLAEREIIRVPDPEKFRMRRECKPPPSHSDCTIPLEGGFGTKKFQKTTK